MVEALATLSAELAGKGLRVTQQRLQVLAALRRLDHPTASELYQDLSAQFPSLSKKTIYSTLETLEEAELAVRVTVGGAPHRYEANTEPHHHAWCRGCGRLADLSPGEAESLPAGRLPSGFRVERMFVTVEGLCAACEASASSDTQH